MSSRGLEIMSDNKALVFMIGVFGIAWAIVGVDAGLQYGMFEAGLLVAPGLALFTLGCVKLIRETRRERSV
ncbi:hypothetical protein LCGC14_0743690 [marine sediment metagenome]|uniref:Uncharacterized protein n=1 Tax=marine sediment metagenome TaxID=412755 RepID=A0A0F9Q5Z3_9ZZZZ